MAVKEVVDMRWLKDGLEDPHPRYVGLPREDLAGAHLFSDDELANKLSMMSTISDERDTAMMIDAHRTNGDYVCKSMLGEIAKDRLRWMSRRIAVLEGRYPGVDANLQPVVKETVEESQEVMAEFRLKAHLPRLCESLYFPENPSRSMLVRLASERGLSSKMTSLEIVFGFGLPITYSKRWHIYVELVRHLLKKHQIYVPFDDDEFGLKDKFSLVVISKSKYFGSGIAFPIKQPMSSSIFPEAGLMNKINLLFNSYSAILDVWYHAENNSWGSNWASGQWSAKDLLKKLYEEITTTEEEHVIKRNIGDPKTNIMRDMVDAYMFSHPDYKNNLPDTKNNINVRTEVANAILTSLTKG